MEGETYYNIDVASDDEMENHKAHVKEEVEGDLFGP